MASPHMLHHQCCQVLSQSNTCVALRPLELRDLELRDLELGDLELRDPFELGGAERGPPGAE